jgi:Fe-S cluster assembly protein SufD
MREQPEIAESALAEPDHDDDRAFVALNTAFQSNGAYVEVPAGVHIDTPIHLLFVSTAAADGRIHQPRNVIRIGANARATVVARYLSVGGDAYATNAVTEVELADGARLDHVGFEHEGARAFHIGTVTARVGRDADFRSHALSLGAGIARHEIRTLLTHTGANCTLNGLYIASGERHVDNQTIVEHLKPGGTSRELYKGILGGSAKGVFNGTVIVHPNAQKTNAQQSNPNLLTSGRAEINSRPNLEIHADDVKCTHGSTVGRLDDDALFFLRARGIYDKSARQMLCHAFASEIINEVPTTLLRERLGRRVDEALRAAGRNEP